MKNYLIKPSKLAGAITLPPSKSHTMRAILFASLANGKSTIRNTLPSPDTDAMIKACQQIGAKITGDHQQLSIIGTAGKPQLPDDIIDVGNSGQVIRFVGAIAALLSGYTVITGDASMRTNRAIQPMLEGLSGLGALAVSTKGDGYAPIIIKGPIHPGSTTLSGEDSQPVSGLLIASAFLSGKTEIKVRNAGEKPWIDLTLAWFDRLGIAYQNNDYTHYIIQGNAAFDGFDYVVPGDFSSAAFPIVAALITNSTITINNIDMHDVQGDKEIIPVLQQMGAQFEIDKKNRILKVKANATLQGREVNINNFVDAITIMAVVGCFAQGETRITGAAIAKKKECDRLACITRELTKMGANINETPDGLVINEQALKGAEVKSFHDHRMVMSLAVAGLAAKGETHIQDVACVAKSYPNFLDDMQKLGAEIKTI